MPSKSDNRSLASVQVPLYWHPTDPRLPFLAAPCLGRAVGLGLLDVEAAMDCLTLMAMRELRKRGTPFSPSGTLARMSWALRDRANWIGAQADLLPMRLAAAIAARLRGQSATMTEEQRNRALDDIEALVQKVADDMGRPHPAGALDGIAAAAYRVAAKRVARERRS